MENTMKEITMADIKNIEESAKARRVADEINHRVGNHAPHEVVGYLLGREEYIDYASGETHWEPISKMVFAEDHAKDWLKANPYNGTYQEWSRGFYQIVFWDGTIGRRIYADANGEADTKQR